MKSLKEKAAMELAVERGYTGVNHIGEYKGENNFSHNLETFQTDSLIFTNNALHISKYTSFQKGEIIDFLRG